MQLIGYKVELPPVHACLQRRSVDKVAISNWERKHALNPYELQELADKMKLEESDLGREFSNDELEENLIPGENFDGDPRPADEFNSSVFLEIAKK
ncbi:hypothetical protein HHI36_023432 [Cryptolaemus montrouzieri]|uniref:Uncharacterized protein n=1 Tax=Cryptolaemus montrouzieri TaxID=559131 RepID=A0ABD2PGQ7_9CUCU